MFSPQNHNILVQRLKSHMKYYRKPAQQQKIALERIDKLFQQAKLRAADSPALAKRYVTLARKIGMKYKVRLPKELRRRFCRACNAYWTSQNSRIRLRSGMVVAYCLECRHFRKFRYK